MGIGAMDKECPHFSALKFKNEPAGMCCTSGKGQLPEIETPPEPLNGLLIGAETNKNVILKDYYAYRLMIRRGQDNVIVRCCELFQQYMVDMYVKIESERPRYLRCNQQKLRAEEYIHLRDAIVSNVDTSEIGG
ncbi:helitron_like_N domain-containing protein [Trichonephila clavipes]|uniref:Helitron_like_N domain-containing protein n=1 Tax=Trichonephila clavipes TaxID=2585209 RepID=A0A8X6VK72_TRICX|nr:helitron_like_N domain-containing protein [Trichonephila clavipes]